MGNVGKVIKNLKINLLERTMVNGTASPAA